MTPPFAISKSSKLMEPIEEYYQYLGNFQHDLRVPLVCMSLHFEHKVVKPTYDAPMSADPDAPSIEWIS